MFLNIRSFPFRIFPNSNLLLRCFQFGLKRFNCIYSLFFKLIEVLSLSLTDAVFIYYYRMQFRTFSITVSVGFLFLFYWTHFVHFRGRVWLSYCLRISAQILPLLISADDELVNNDYLSPNHTHKLALKVVLITRSFINME